MRTKEEILKEEHYKKFSVFDEIFIDIRDQLKRIANNLKPIEERIEIAHPSTKEIEERIDKLTDKFIKLSPKEPNNK